MDKTYNPKQAEDKLYKMWEKRGYFSPKIDSKKKPFTIIMPPPNANGVLHIGHAVFVALEDIMTRYHRMKGDSTLWAPGADHAGIMTQVVYEKKLAKQGKTRFNLGREKFYKQTFDFSMENKKIMENQLRKLGASCDWTRSKFTLDPEISEAVLFTFKKMYDDGLIYRGERIINWCPRCQTALSDLEVSHKEKPGSLYYIKYPIANPVDSLPDKAASADEFITVATTRPETMLGDTAVAVNPADKRYRLLLQSKTMLKLPLTNRTIPLIANKRVDADFGTGAVKVTPAHNGLDFEISQTHNLPLINVIAPNNKMNENAGKNYEGLPIGQCRKKIIEDLRTQNLFDKEEPYAVSIALCERCKAIIEPLISKQWFIKTKKLAEPAIKAVRNKQIEFIPKRFEKVFFHWMDNIRDWCISRQIWWGHRIPVWYCQCGETIVETKEPKKCPKCKSSKLTQDPDTVDTWFSSGQWPFTMLGWPNKTADFDYFYPTNVMETGWDILFFWVARMIMLGIYCAGKPPFSAVYLHGLVRDKDKQKMSKSKGNVVDPLGVIDAHGADALRMALVFGTGPGNDIIISEEKIIGQKRFANKIWNASRFVLTQTSDCPKQNIYKLPNKTQISEADIQILEELNKTIKSSTKNIENFQFHQAAETLYHFFWRSFCDKYIETAKQRIEQGTMEEKTAAQQVLLYALLTSLKLLHPFMPFVTEAVYQLLPNTPSKALIIESWPKPAE